jgi:hypothetical protein
VKSTCGQRPASVFESPPLTTCGASWFALEPRIMFDGAGVATLSTVATEPLVQSQAEALSSPEYVTASDAPPDPAPTGEPQFNSRDQALFDALAAYDTSAARQEIVFLSPSVRDYHKLLDGISPNVEVIILDPTRDGVQQMAEVLAGRTGVDAIHIISHGSQAELSLGSARLTLEAMNGVYTDELAAIGQSLSEKADLVIYGCNFGQGELGQQAADRLAGLTGADVAASTDNTGHAELGGDWDMELHVGAIDTASVLSDAATEKWMGLLAENILESYEPIFSDMSDQAYEVKLSQPWGQTFGFDSPGATYTVNRIGLVLYRDAAATSQVITVSLRSSWNGPVIASGQVSSSSLGTTEAWVHIDLTTPATLTDNATYYVRVDSNTDSGMLYVGVHDAGLYANGDLINTSGTSQTSKDLAFRIIEATANAAPMITNLIGDTLAYNEGDGTVVIEQGANATVSDADSTDFDTGTLVVSFVAGNDSTEDVLSIRHEGAGAGQIGMSGSNVTYGGVTIGTFSGGSGGADLVVTFNSSGAPPAAQALIHNITYQNTDTDAPTTGARTVRFVLTDGDGGTSGDHDATVTVSALNDPPMITSNGGGATAAVNAAENQTAVTTVTSTDVDGGPATYSIVGGADATLFALNAATGELTFLAAPDFEAPGDAGGNNVYDVTVQVADGNGGTVTQAISVSVVNHSRVYDQFNTVSYGGNNGDQNWLSNWTEIGESNGTGSGVVRVSSSGYMVIGGDDVTITGRGASRAADLAGATSAILTFDYRRVDIDGGGGSISLQISSNGGGNWTNLATYSLSSFDAAFVSAQFDVTAFATAATQIRFIGSGTTEAALRVDNVAIEYDGSPANVAPIITSNGGGDAASIVLQENNTNVTTVTAGDADVPVQTLTYSIIGGDDAGFFSINPSTGGLSFITAPDFETPLDATGDNVYDVTVQVSDGNGGSDTQTIAVMVTKNPIIYDQFHSVTYNGNDGTQPWSTSWVETEGGGAGPSAGQIRVTGGALYIDASLGTAGNTIYREVNLTGAVSATLSYAYNSALGIGGVVEVQISDDGGANYTTLENYTSLLPPSGTGNFDITSYISANTRLRFEVTGALLSNNIQFDDVQISYITNDAPVNTVPGPQTVNEDTTLGLGGISANDVDGNLSTVQLGVLNGTVTVTLQGGVTISAGSNGSNTLTLSGTQADINATLATLGYQGALHYTGPDTLTVTATDTNSASDVDTVAITVDPVNDPPVVMANAGSTVPRGGTDTVTTAELQVTDIDNTPAQLTYTVTVASLNGQLELISAPGIAITTFTQAQIDAGHVVYVHDGSFTASDNFTFTVSDGAGGNIGATTYGITVSPVNSSPILAINAGSTVVQGLTDIITAGELQVIDLDNTSAQLLYTLTTAPANGQLELTTVPGMAITTFTQADINAGRVVFVHSGAASTSDSFRFTVSDGAGGAIGSTTFMFTVAPFIPPPPATPPILVPQPPAPPSGAGPPPAGSPPLPPVVVPAPINPKPNSEVPLVPVPPGTDPDGTALLSSEVPGASPPKGINTPAPSVQLMRELRGYVEEGVAPRMYQADEGVRRAFGEETLEKAPTSLSEAFRKNLGLVEEDLRRATDMSDRDLKFAVGVTNLGGVSLTAGVIAWLLRSGALLASLAATLPAWRHFDPLPVVLTSDRTRRKSTADTVVAADRENKQFRGLRDLLDKKGDNGRSDGEGREG